MTFTKMIQPFGDDRIIQCPECFSQEWDTNLNNQKEGMTIRWCVNHHQWLDAITLKEWRIVKRMEGSRRSGNFNQHKNKKKATYDDPK